MLRFVFCLVFLCVCYCCTCVCYLSKKRLELSAFRLTKLSYVQKKTINLLNVIEGITIMIISLNIIMKWNEVNEVFSHEKEKLPAIAIVILCSIVVF